VKQSVGLMQMSFKTSARKLTDCFVSLAMTQAHNKKIITSMKTYQQKGNNSLLIINHKTSKKVFINDVVLLKGDINYTIFYLESGKQKVVAHSIKFFEPFLETHGFLRVHRSFMINPNHVKGYNQNDEFLMMTNGQRADISRRRKSVLKDFG
jgi:DNA-binding LytR/AlgR family response regulator